MLNRLPFFGTNSILLQIRLVAASIALASLFIVFVVIEESVNSSEILDEHFRLVAADRHIAEFKGEIIKIQSLSMSLASTGNVGSDVIDHQIELFEEVHKAEVLATRVSNLGPEYARAIHPYKFGEVLQDIANQVLEIKFLDNVEENKKVIDRLDATTFLLTARISELAAQTAQRSLDSRKRMGHELFKALVVILVACCLNLLACLFLARHLVRRVADPAQQIAQTTEDLANGNLDIEVPDSNLLELKAIASALEKFRESAHRENRLAFEDPVSRLPNRRAFLNKLNEKIEDQNAGLILVYIDVDHFKDINDGYGHTTGDTLVRTVGERLKQIVGHHDIIARVGGDEFAILITCDADNTPETIGKTIINKMHEPLCCGESKVTITLSVGIAMTGVERSASALMQEADIALYHAKESGRDQFSIYSTNMAVEKNLMRHLERDLPQAIHADQMRMVYQPIINISNSDAQELEALIRWEHPELGPIQPDVFIGVAERSGFINLLGIWILERVYSDMRAWPDARVSINLSPIQLKSKDFVQDVLEIGRRFGISPHRIEFEITESMDIENSERAILTLGLLRSYGFRIALDDFGTGYSSLSFIKNYPLDRIKLDRSLLEGAGAGGIADAVLGAALTLGSRMKLEVVAEGVEETNQVEQMKEVGCSHLQGYYFSKPLEHAQVHDYLSAPGVSVKDADVRKNAA